MPRPLVTVATFSVIAALAIWLLSSRTPQGAAQFPAPSSDENADVLPTAKQPGPTQRDDDSDIAHPSPWPSITTAQPRQVELDRSNQLRQSEPATMKKSREIALTQWDHFTESAAITPQQSKQVLSALADAQETLQKRAGLTENEKLSLSAREIADAERSLNKAVDEEVRASVSKILSAEQMAKFNFYIPRPYLFVMGSPLVLADTRQ